MNLGMDFEMTPEQELVVGMDRLQVAVGEMKEEQKAQRMILTGNGKPRDGLVSKVDRLDDRVGNLEKLGDKHVRLIETLTGNVRLFAERRAAQPGASGGVPWSRLGFEIAKGIGIAVGSAVTLSVIAVFIVGLKVSWGVGP